MRVFLVHGMARSPASMLLLARRLRGAGYPTTLFGYHVTVESLDSIAERFERRVRSVMEKESRDDGAPPSYAVIGHSLGNVITRLASPKLPAGFSRFAMLAPPNRSPVAARKLQDNPVFQLLARDSGQRLADPSFFEELPKPDVRTLVVAGTAGPKSPWLPFEGEVNDGVLTVEETELEDTLRVEVPGVHTFIMNRRDVFERLVSFLRNSDSDADASPGPSPSD